MSFLVIYTAISFTNIFIYSHTLLYFHEQKRNEDEIAYTGKLAECVETLPLPLIAQMGVFTMADEDFEDSFGFSKPSMDETIVFTCKAGIRSMHAAQFAAMCGYSNLINYSGGSDDWFR